MLKFNDYLTEAVSFYDNLQSTKPEETERHRKKYYDDSSPDSIFHKIDGRYILDRDRTDLHKKYGKGEEVKLTSVQKLPDSSGVIRYHGITEHGHAVPMSHFRKPAIGRAGKNQQSLEQEQINYLHKTIKSEMKKNGGKPIRIRTPDGQIHKVAGIKQVEGGWPKADAYLHDENGEPVHWMSLKGDKFQQWGGYKGLDNHPVMKNAIEQFRKLKNKLSPKERYLPARSAYHVSLDENDPSHRDLLHKSMYGMEHGGEYGPNNVHAIYSGNTVGLKQHPKGKFFELDPNALYVNRNDETSDTAKSKILITNRAGYDQQGTGGRMMISHTGNVANSKELPIGNPSPTPPAAASKRSYKTGEHISGEIGGRPFRGPTE
jgi:hypothetical protein